MEGNRFIYSPCSSLGQPHHSKPGGAYGRRDELPDRAPLGLQRWGLDMMETDSGELCFLASVFWCCGRWRESQSFDISKMRPGDPGRATSHCPSCKGPDHKWYHQLTQLWETAGPTCPGAQGSGLWRLEEIKGVKWFLASFPSGHLNPTCSKDAILKLRMERKKIVEQGVILLEMSKLLL